MKLIIFSGFLGSGKTLLILSLAEKILRNADVSRINIVIIENEIGETGIDDKVLNDAGYEVRTMLAGCICCTLSVDLTIALNDILDKYDPEYVIFEPTGIALPDRIVKTVEEYGKGISDVSIITVVDAKRYDMLTHMTPSLLSGQLKPAEFIFINKCDLVSEDALEEISSEVSRTNGAAKVFRVSALNGISEGIWDEVIHRHE
ncbi:MAG: hypothetical protein FWH52_01815 [Synergistaceae bacterium]|nr:hypothetical protein [Synergistaceae bacterium]